MINTKSDDSISNPPAGLNITHHLTDHNTNPRSPFISRLRNVLVEYKNSMNNPSSKTQLANSSLKLSKYVETEGRLRGSIISKIVCKSADTSLSYSSTKKPPDGKKLILNVQSNDGPLQICINNNKKHLKDTGPHGSPDVNSNRDKGNTSMGSGGGKEREGYNERFNFNLKRNSNMYKSISKKIRKGREADSSINNSMIIDLRQTRRVMRSSDSSTEINKLVDDQSSLIKNTDATLSVTSKSKIVVI